MSQDDKITLTPEQAESLLPEGPQVHNFVQAGPMLLGADHDRDYVVQALASAAAIEIGGPMAMALCHPLAVWSSENSVSFYAADMDRVTTFLESAS